MLNADDPAVAAMASRTRARVLTVGRSPGADVRADDVVLDAGRARFRLVVDHGAAQGTADVALRLVGAHHVGNALAAAAVALECGATPEGVAAALSGAAPASRWRMEVTDRPDGVTVINDAYNANPESMRAALQALASVGSGSRRTWAVLGRMAELGEQSAAAHAETAAVAAELGVDELVTVAAPEYGRRPGGRRRRRGPRAAARRAGARRRRAGEGLAGGRPGPPGGCAPARAGARGVRGVFIAAGVALAISILLTPYLIRFFARQGFGQEIRDEGPQSHKAKRGTPTMGGVAILIAIWVGYLVSHGLTGEPITASALLVLFLTTALGVVGFLDDFIKLRRQRNLGLNKTSKLVGQLLTALVFGILAARFVNAEGLSPASTNLSFVRDITVISFGVVGFVVFGYFVIAAWSNAVNLTDGLDGLAAGTAAMVLATYVIIGFWQFRNACAHQRRRRLLPGARPAGRRAGRGRRDGRLHRLPVVERRAAPGSSWATPGSLALGGLIAGLSIVTRTELLLVVIGGVFVVETLSVALQIVVFRTTRRRVFRMAPFHHHFELAGWAETTVIIRFWLLAAMCAALGLGLFYSEWLTASSGIAS